MMDLDSLLSDDAEFVFGGELANTEIPETIVSDTKEKVVTETTEEAVKEPAVVTETDTVITDPEVEVAGDDSPNLVFLNLLTEKGIMNPLDEDTSNEFRGLDFETQTEKLLEFYDNTVVERANAMFNEYNSEKPSKLRLIEENYKNGMSEEDAIKFAMEAPTVYNPVFDTERDEVLEKKLIIDEYSKLFGGDTTKAEILFSHDFESGKVKDRAIEISRARNEAWVSAQKDHFSSLEQASAKQVEAFNESKRKYTEYLKTTDELLPNLKISKDDKIKLFEARYKPIQTENGVTTALDQKINSNPDKANALMSYLFVELDILNKPSNIEKIYKIGKTAQTNGIIDQWKKTSAGITGKTTLKVSPQKQTLSDFNFGD